MAHVSLCYRPGADIENWKESKVMRHVPGFTSYVRRMARRPHVAPVDIFSDVERTLITEVLAGFVYVKGSEFNSVPEWFKQVAAKYRDEHRFFKVDRGGSPITGLLWEVIFRTQYRTLICNDSIRRISESCSAGYPAPS